MLRPGTLGTGWNLDRVSTTKGFVVYTDHHELSKEKLNALSGFLPSFVIRQGTFGRSRCTK